MKLDTLTSSQATTEVELGGSESEADTTSAEVIPGDHTALDNADKLINNYVHQYLIERGYHQTADCFKDELPEDIAGNISSQTADCVNVGFLGDWWMLVQDVIPLFNSTPGGQQTAQTESTSVGISGPLSSSSGPISTCCETIRRDGCDHPSANVDRLLALSFAQVRSGPQPEDHHQNEHTHISPQMLHRSPSAPRIADKPLASTSWSMAPDRGYRLHMPSMAKPIQVELVGTPAPSFAPPSTPPSPTPEVSAPAASGSKKRQRVRKPATGPPKTKTTTAARPTKRRRSQTVTSRTKVIGEEGGDEGVRVLDRCAASPLPSTQSYDYGGSPLNARHEKLDSAQDSCVRIFEEGLPTIDDAAADAALMAELARYAASYEPATSSQPRDRQDPASSSTASSGLNASLWAQVAAQPGPAFVGVMTNSSTSQPSLMLLPDLTPLTAQQEMSFLECDPFNVIGSTSGSSHHQGSTVQGSDEVSRQPGFSVPWTPTEAPQPVSTHANGSSVLHPTINVPLLCGQDSDLDLFPALRDQLLPVARKAKRSGDVLLAHEEDATASQEPIYSYFNPAGETMSFQPASPTGLSMSYGETNSSFRVQTSQQTWQDYSEDVKPTQRLTQDKSNCQAQVARTSGPTFTPVRAHSASHLSRADLPSSLSTSVTPARPATHAGHSQSHSTAKGVTPFTHLSRRSVSHIASELAPWSYGATHHAHAHADGQNAVSSQRESDVVKQALHHLSSPEKAGDNSKSSATSSESLFPLSFSTTTRTTPIVNSNSSPHCQQQSQPPLGIPPHCIDFDFDTSASSSARVGKNVSMSKATTEADRRMAAKLQRGMLAQEQAREKMVEYFRPKVKSKSEEGQGEEDGG
ncbi:hypothetical protein BCV69DRAFT_216957 [Microstroma glucosiphilum]|uniref:Uncharacterized protein n=1 Tax=Pseudomicrostroma glucosiphilum TaxID=1684307 RepID=A0A316U462_9BASI|nr:hypothetical protein BCV69DRAFT_216957 [Pseudomicrostroma glucosiphilum]PWN20027.1 hypothetical protein BCV69DRAFT_216957 [Pseudomicrostroma glucosiphilum]